MRYWYTIIPNLKGKNGRQPCVAPAEALALRVLAHPVRELQCDIAVLKGVAGSLFKEFGGGDWQRMEHRTAILIPANNRVLYVTEREHFPAAPEHACIYVRLSPHVRALRGFLLGIDVDVPASVGVSTLKSTMKETAARGDEDTTKGLA
jgi:hypothetical protein